MPTFKELTDKYGSYSDEELYATRSQIDQYTPEAREALEFVLTEKGGLEALVKRVQSKAESLRELERLFLEAQSLLNTGTPPAVVKNTLHSAQVSPDQIAGIVDSCVCQKEREISDVKIKPRTIIGSLFGGLLGGTIGGVVLGISMIQSHRFMFIFLGGTIMLC